MIDGGKHKSIPYLIAVLSNSRLDTSPLIVDCVRYFRGKKVDYSKVVEKLLVKLFNDHIKITAIVTDNLPVQVTAINHKFTGSLQQITLYPKVAKVIWLSCSCHCLALSLSDSAKKCDYGDLVQNLLETASFLRSKNIANAICMRCPASSKTRWTCIFDISFWMVKNFKKIYDAISDSLTAKTAYDIPDNIVNGFTKTASKLFAILLPFKLATHKLEADRMPAAYVTPVINVAIKKLDDIAVQLNIEKKL